MNDFLENEFEDEQEEVNPWEPTPEQEPEAEQEPESSDYYDFSSINRLPYFGVLKDEITRLLDANPQSDANIAYEFLLGRKIRANIEKKQSHKLTSSQLEMCKAFGNNPQEIQKYVQQSFTKKYQKGGK